MHTLHFLASTLHGKSNHHVIQFEYRLVASGVLYNSRVITTDWTKSEASRLIMHSPATLVVCSHPIDEYPQELALRFSSPLLEEKHNRNVTMYYPDEEIARDLAALLTLMVRRLVTVAAKVREIHPREYDQQPEFLLDYPIGHLKGMAPIYWEARPASVISGPNGVIELTDFNPPPLGVDPEALARRLLALSSSPNAQQLLTSARLYSLAMLRLHDDIDLAYQLLISCVEATANAILRDFSPTRDEMLLAKRQVLNKALQFGLPQDQAEELAIEACADMQWEGRKFVKFLTDNCDERVWQEDDLFHPPDFALPSGIDFPATLRSIYAARSGMAHHGRGYPGTAAFGIQPTVPWSAFYDHLASGVSIPPVVWFERVVNLALNRYIATLPQEPVINDQDDAY